MNRYVAVGRPDSSLVSLAIGANQLGDTLFKKYGETDDDRQLTIEAHGLRHLQNTELFRLGVADTIISKRFNRRSVTQCYEYDHRSLANDLDQSELPQAIEVKLGEKATLTDYQHRQNEYRRWRGRVGKKSGVQVAATIADKDIKVADLESQVALLTARSRND